MSSSFTPATYEIALRSSLIETLIRLREAEELLRQLTAHYAPPVEPQPQPQQEVSHV